MICKKQLFLSVFGEGGCFMMWEWVGLSLIFCSCFWCGLFLVGGACVGFFLFVCVGFFGWVRVFFGWLVGLFFGEPRRAKICYTEVTISDPYISPKFNKSCVCIPSWKYNQRLGHVIDSKTNFFFSCLSGFGWDFFLFFSFATFVFKVNLMQANKLNYTSANCKTCLLQVLKICFSKAELIVMTLKYICF